MGVAAIVVGAIATVGSTVAQQRQASKAADAQRETAAQQRASNTAEAARSRRENLRRQRIQQAQIEASGAAQGTAGSSAPMAVANNLSQGVASSTAATGKQQTAINNQAQQQQVMADARARASTFAAIGSLGSTAFQLGAGTQAGQDFLADPLAKFK